jgi:hypothetical protein
MSLSREWGSFVQKHNHAWTKTEYRYESGTNIDRHNSVENITVKHFFTKQNQNTERKGVIGGEGGKRKKLNVVFWVITTLSGRWYSPLSPKVMEVWKELYLLECTKVGLTFSPVRYQVRLCGICGGESSTGLGPLRVLRFPLPLLIPPTAPCSLITPPSNSLDTDSVVK